MRLTRRTLLIGGGSGVLTVLLASCIPEPAPSPTSTRTPSPTPPRTAVTPAAAVRSTWSTDPFARGAASYTPVGVQPAARDALAEPVGTRLFFAGEATAPNSPGTMRGAVQSGRRAAAEASQNAAAGERIAVIGAGLAGAYAAAGLADRGAVVTVIEAKDHSGGRIHTVIDDAWPLPIQLGAWLFTTADAQLRAELDELNVATAVLDAPQWTSGDGAVDPVGDETITAAVESAQAMPADVSLARALAEAGTDPADPDTAALLAYVTAMTGADADDQSSWFPPPLPRDDYAAAVDDLSPLVDSLLEGVEVRLSSPVSRIAHDDSGVSLRLGTGESMSFDRVVITVPLGVLQDGSIEFDPLLPFGTRGAIGALGMGRIETVWLRFDTPFWETDATIWHLVGGDVTVRTWFNLLPVTGESVLVGMVGGAAAEDFAVLDDAQAVAVAASSLDMLVPGESDS
ncbi:MAG TPA: FAD-dependent oxidoreductase [Microbacterium sp.]|nr:FAD-dependent oxidoreductase [Microbacterium sp.]